MIRFPRPRPLARPARPRRPLAAVAVGTLALAGTVLAGSGTATGADAPAEAAMVWSLAGDWAAQWNAPGGPSNTTDDLWQYFLVSSAHEADPDSYELLDTPGSGGCAHAGITQSWTRSGGGNVDVALTGTHDYGSCAPNLAVPAGTADLGPGGNGVDVGVMWTSPITGTVSVSGFVRDNDHGGGDGVSWSLRDGSGAVLTGGSFGNGGEQAMAEGTGAAAALQSIQVTQGERLVFLVNPDPAGGTGGSFLYDNTGVNLAISRSDVPLAEGTVLTWGDNGQGELGTGNYTSRLRPGPLGLPDGVTGRAVATGSAHTLVLGSDGAVYGAGQNTEGQLGDGGNGYATQAVAAALPGGVSATAVSAGDSTSVALTGTGDVYAWGSNEAGQLGDGTSTDSSDPVKVLLPSAATAIATGGSTSLALTTGGEVYAWGSNAHGELGTGSDAFSSPTPAKVAFTDGTVIRAIAAGQVHNLALADDGTVWAWGRNYSGELGDGTTDDHNVPVRVHLPDGAEITDVAAGDAYSLAVDSHGRVYSWGSAIGGAGDVPTPAAVALPDGVLADRVVAGDFAAAVVTTTGRLLAWGDNDAGQLGDGTTDERSVPASVDLPSRVRVADVDLGSDWTVVLEGLPADPAAALAATSATDGTAPFTVSLDAGQSLAPDGTSFVFTCGDGSRPTQAGFGSPTATCTYAAASPDGGYQASVELRDPATDRTYQSAPVAVTVAPPPPAARLTASSDHVAAGAAVHLDASGSTIPSGATFAFHCGDSDATVDADAHATSADCSYHRGSPADGWAAWVSMHDPATGRDYQDTVFVHVDSRTDTVDGSAAFDAGHADATVTVHSDGSLSGDTTACGAATMVDTTCTVVDGSVVRLFALPGTFEPGTQVFVYRGDTDTLQAELGEHVLAQGGFAVTWTPQTDRSRPLSHPLLVTIETGATQPALRSLSAGDSGRMRPMGFDLGGFFGGIYNAVVDAGGKVLQTVGSFVQAAANAVSSWWQSATQSLSRPNGSDVNNLLFCDSVTTRSDGKVVCTGATAFVDVPTVTISSLVAGGRVIAAGGGNVIAAGGGNVIAAGGGNVIAAGGGNILSNVSGGYVIAAGGGNVIAAGGGNVIAAGGGNVIAAGGGNVIAAGGGNLTMGLTLDPGFAVATPQDATPPTVSATADPGIPESGSYPAGTSVTVHLSATSHSDAPVQHVSYSAEGAVSIPHTIAAGAATDLVVDQPGLTTITYSAQDAGLNRADAQTLEIAIGDEADSGDPDDSGDSAGGSPTSGDSGGRGGATATGSTVWSSSDHTPSPAVPVVASVTSPRPGTITVVPGGPGARTTGYSMLDSSFEITAPAATASDPLRLSFRIDASALPTGADPASITVFRDGVAVPVCAAASATTADPDPCVAASVTTNGITTVTVLSSHASVWTFGVTAGACASTPFPDVSGANPLCADIAWLKARKLTTGYSDGGFHPAAPVSRQAMAAYLYRAAHGGTTAPACTGAPFSDVPPGSAFCGAITWLKTSGVATGYADGGFHPAAPVSRQAMAAYLYRAAHGGTTAPACTSGPFPDVPDGRTFCGAVAWLKTSGIATGYADGSFHPAAPVTRQATAAYLHRYGDGNGGQTAPGAVFPSQALSK